MRQILSSSNRAILEQYAFSNLLLAFDFDGTLAPIVTDPGAAQMRPSTRALLEEVATRYPCVIISGRAQADVLRRLRGIHAAEIIGNHGLEPWKYGEPLAERVRMWVRHVSTALGSFAGVEIEDKVFSLAVHYRRSREKRLVRQAIAAVAGTLADVRVIGGKQVVNLVPVGAPHKGIALQAARHRLGCDTALYVGDDDTDEDVFSLDEPGRLLTIRVGSNRTTRAQFCLRQQHQIDELLRALLSMRASGTRSTHVA